MPAADGTPTIWEKAAVALGFGAAIGLTPEEISATQAGEQRDLTKAEQDVFVLFKPILSQAESQGMSDLVNLIQGILTLVPGVSSVSGAVKIVESVLTVEAGTLADQAKALGQTSLTTLVSAALAALGKSNLPSA